MRFSVHRVHHRPGSGGRGLWLPALVFGAVLLILGTVFTVVGNQDYADHTGRAEAVVVERVVTSTRDSDGRRDSDIDVYVAYEANGRSFEGARLSGLNPGDHFEGDTVQVAYRPDDPGSPVTARSTEPGAFRIFLLIGIGALVLAVPLLVLTVVLFVRGRR